MPVGLGFAGGRSRRAVPLALAAALLSSTHVRGQSSDRVPRSRLGQEIAVLELPVGAPESPAEASPENPTGPVTLADALRLALLQSPDLAAFAWERRALEARVLQAARPPNPVLTTLVQDIGGRTRLSGADDPIQSQVGVELSQLVELGGKRAARRRLASLDRELADWDYETARIDVLTEVTRAFLDVLASQEAVTLAADTAKVVDDVLNAVTLRVAAGVASPIEQTRADIAVASVRIESDRAGRTLDAHRTRLAALWGGASAAFQAATGDLTPLVPVPPFAGLQARIAENPDLARWSSEVAQREAALALERSRRVPDLTLTGGYRRYPEVDASAYVVGASIALPLFNRNHGGVQEATARVRRSEEERRASELRVTMRLADAYRALGSAHDEATALSARVAPSARSAFDAVTEGYRLGRFGYLDVLDAQRTLVASGGQYVRALADYHKAVADLERLLGAPLNTPPASPRSPGQE